MKLLLPLLAVVLAAAWFFHQHQGSIRRPPGVLAPRGPQQAAVADPTTWEFAGYRITPLASYDIEARVLGTRSYRRDDWSDLCGLDVALGWQRMSDSAVLDRLQIWQEGRFFWWRTDSFPIPRAEIELSAANTHVISASERVAAELGELRPGDVVRLRGKLIEAQKPGGRPLRSSLRRDDTGKGACEIMWVESVERQARP